MIVDDNALLNVYCWRCKEPLISALTIEPGVLVICSCQGITRLPELKLEKEGVSERAQKT